MYVYVYIYIYEYVCVYMYIYIVYTLYVQLIQNSEIARYKYQYCKQILQK